MAINVAVSPTVYVGLKGEILIDVSTGVAADNVTTVEVEIEPAVPVTVVTPLPVELAVNNPELISIVPTEVSELVQIVDVANAAPN